ncbi:oxepin-CoA hydrolase, alternative type [Comamonas granuli]|uniref:oxepin-CoA hydrolase, alternative type n=1 Tax=Comamonas granuli TaxID=290309 RepID=UPI0005A64ACE|nr:enoyl-CoA hydratase [Comamonas granuli]
MPAELRSTSHGTTLVLTISHPELRNALEPSIYAAGIEALGSAERNPDVRCAVITGAQGTFSAGGNLQRLQAQRAQGLQAPEESIRALHHWIEAIRTWPKPVIAAVEGAAAGAGFSLALACDLIVAARNARFAMAYTRVGLSPDGGASWSLARALPRTLAAELLLCGESVAAERLHALGVVNRLADPGSALEAALALADTLAAGAPNALASTKELLAEAEQQPLSAQLDLERAHFLRNLLHANAGEGMAAFLQKRPPQYR